MPPPSGRPVPPGRLTPTDQQALAPAWAQARAARDWEPIADALAQHRAAGVPVVELAAAAGVSVQSVRAVCRAHGPDPATLGDPVTDAGWVRTPEAAQQLGTPAARLEEHAPAGELAGVSVVIGWYRRWHARSLPAWWAATNQPTRAETRRRSRAERAERMRAAVGDGGTWQQAADTEGVSIHTVWRDLRG